MTCDGEGKRVKRQTPSVKGCLSMVPFFLERKGRDARRKSSSRVTCSLSPCVWRIVVGAEKAEGKIQAGHRARSIAQMNARVNNFFNSTNKPARFVGQRGGPNEPVNNRIRTNRFHCAAFGRQARDPGFRSEVAPAAIHIQGDPLPQPDRQAPPHARL